MKSKLHTLAFYCASITIVLCWLLFVLFFHNPTNRVLFVVGNVIVGVSILLILLAMVALRRKGNLQEGEDFTATTVIVEHGIYSVVRHPLYLGWLLTYPAVMLVSQHWLIVILGVIGIVSIEQITRMADEQLVEKFGVDYETYMQEVPRLNILLGIVWALKRRDKIDKKLSLNKRFTCPESYRMQIGESPLLAVDRRMRSVIKSVGWFVL